MRAVTSSPRRRKPRPAPAGATAVRRIDVRIRRHQRAYRGAGALAFAVVEELQALRVDLVGERLRGYHVTTPMFTPDSLVPVEEIGRATEQESEP